MRTDLAEAQMPRNNRMEPDVPRQDAAHAGIGRTRCRTVQRVNTEGKRMKLYWGIVFAAIVAGAGTKASVARAQEAEVQEGRFISIGGIDQWITVRGEDRENPVILFLHGGPGSSLSPFAEALFEDWEQHFTLVQWDQPGAGKTFGETGEAIAAVLSLSRIVDDGIAVSEYIKSYLEKEKIILLGGSWGSIVGVHMAHRRPGLFHAYVGTAQIVNLQSGLTESFSLVMERASARADAETLEQLDANGPPPWDDVSSLGAFWEIARRYEAENTMESISPMELFPPDYSEEDIQQRFAGDIFSQLHFIGQNMDGELMQVDLAATIDRIGTPTFIIQGAEDLISLPTHAEAFLNGIEAPHKEYIVLPNVGHDIFTQAPDEILREMLQRVMAVIQD